MESLRRAADEGLGRGPRKSSQLHGRHRRLRDLGRHSGDGAKSVRQRGSPIPQAQARRLPRNRLQVEGGFAGHQRSRMSRASRLDHADRGGSCHGTRRRSIARRIPAAEDLLYQLYADRVHPQHALRLQGFGHRIRTAQGLPVLRSRLPRSDDAFTVQPHPVESPIVEDPRRHALHGLHRAGIPVLRV